MNSKDLKGLSLAERTCAVVAYGTFLAFRQKEGCTMVLYYMGKSFGEAYYDRSLNKVILARGFQDASCFNSYLPFIKLAGLEPDE